MAFNAEINKVPTEWEDTYDESTSGRTETHDSQQCEYEILGDWKVVLHDTKLYLLVRTCRCNKYSSKASFKQKKFINIDEVEDGIEIHLTRRCHYSVKRIPSKGAHQYRLEKICYCPKVAKNV